LTFKAKLAFFYLLTFGMTAVWAIIFFLKWYFIAWLFYFVPLLCRRFIHPFPKAYKNINGSKIANACLIIFSILALALAVINVVFANTNPFSAARLEKINAYGFIAFLVFLIPVVVMYIREEIKYAIKADAEASDKRGVN